MTTQESLGYLTCPTQNSGRWRLFFATEDTSVRELMLTLILRDAASNEVRWKVYIATGDENTREEALELITRHAEVIDELWHVYFHTQSHDLCTRILVLIEFACKIQLRYLETNSARWALLARASGLPIHTMILSKILDNTTSDGERWEVLFRTKDSLLKRRALQSMSLFKSVK